VGFGWLGNLCCNWAKFFIELGFNSPTSSSLVLVVSILCCLLQFFFVNNKIIKLICITFVHIYQFLKIENW
jgi:hypothetical protein